MRALRLTSARTRWKLLPFDWPGVPGDPAPARTDAESPRDETRHGNEHGLALGARSASGPQDCCSRHEWLAGARGPQRQEGPGVRSHDAPSGSFLLPFNLLKVESPSKPTQHPSSDSTGNKPRMRA
jgi:hypothetical protein